MIYIFDNDGRCIFKSNSVRKRTVDVDPIISMNMEDMRGSGSTYYLISDHDYDINDIYYEAGALKQRPFMPVQVLGRVLSNLPTPCTVHIEGKKYPCDDSVLEVDFSYPGTYVVRLERFPYMDRFLKVTKV